MGKFLKSRFSLVLFASLTFLPLYSQEEESGPFTTGVDFYSSYIWRGTRFGTGPAVQPSLKYAKGYFTAGAWGSFDFNGYQETDLFLSFALPAGFSMGITDYYFPDLKYFDYSKESGSHAFELNLGFTKGGFNLSSYYMLNEAGGAGSCGNDLYFEAGYSFKYCTLFMGAGNGWHTYNSLTGQSNFNICNLGLKVSKSVKITDSFGIPFTGQLIFNPDKEQLFVVVGFTL